MDGYVVTATNAAIRNTADSGSIQVTGVEVQPGAYGIENFEDFSGRQELHRPVPQRLSHLRGGRSGITNEAFPAIDAGKALAIQYQVKVGGSSEVSAVKAATVVFTIAGGRVRRDRRMKNLKRLLTLLLVLCLALSLASFYFAAGRIGPALWEIPT